MFSLKRLSLYRDDDGIAVLPNSSGFKVLKLKNPRIFQINRVMSLHGITTGDNWLSGCEAQLELSLIHAL